MLIERLLRVALLGSEWVLYLLLLLSVVSLTTMAERALFFRRHRGNLEQLKSRLLGALDDGDFAGAKRILRHSPGVPARVGELALTWAHGGPEAMQEVAEVELSRQRKRLELGLNFLGTLGNNAPFIGLFGTVLGVIIAFHALGTEGAAGGAMGGVMSAIAEALVATGVGLFVALPAVVAYNVLQQKIGEIEADAQALVRLLVACVRTHGAPLPQPRSSQSQSWSRSASHSPAASRSDMAGTLSSRGRRGGIVGINVTPLVDVVLVLLIIMMVSSTYIVSQSLKVELPKAKSGGPTTARSYQVLIGESGDLKLNDRPCSLDEFAESVRKNNRDGSLSLNVAADRKVHHGRVVEVIDRAKLSGVTKFAISVAPANE